MKTFIRIVCLWLIIQIIYDSGYKKTKEADYHVSVDSDSTEIDSSFPKDAIYHKPIDKKYKGKWVDPTN